MLWNELFQWGLVIGELYKQPTNQEETHVRRRNRYEFVVLLQCPNGVKKW